MNKQQAINESIEHWERMIRWAEKQPQKDSVSYSKMYGEIGETWGMKDCSLCVNYYPAESPICSECPLYQKYGLCGESNKNKWKPIIRSKLWGVWVKNARAFLQQLKSLED